jgi:hypothetical protein
VDEQLRDNDEHLRDGELALQTIVSRLEEFEEKRVSDSSTDSDYRRAHRRHSKHSKGFDSKSFEKFGKSERSRHKSSGHKSRGGPAAPGQPARAHASPTTSRGARRAPAQRRSPSRDTRALKCLSARQNLNSNSFKPHPRSQLQTSPLHPTFTVATVRASWCIFQDDRHVSWGGGETSIDIPVRQ